MNASRSAERVGRILETDLADRLRAADLAPDLVALLLAERAEVAVHVAAGRQRHDRADVLALDVERPALGDLARAERRGEGVGRRVAAAEPAQVDDVPRPAVGRRRRGSRRVAAATRRQVRRGGEDRRVVGVVRRAEEDGRRRRRDRRQLGVARRGASSCGWRVARLDLVAVHQRDDGDRLGVRSRAVAGHDDQRLLVRIRAVGVPPGPLERPAGERGRPRTARGQRVPRRTVDLPDRASLDPEWRAVDGPVDVLCRRRTGRLCCKGGEGHGANASTGRGSGCWGNLRFSNRTFVIVPTIIIVGQTARMAPDGLSSSLPMTTSRSGSRAAVSTDAVAARAYTIAAFAIALVILILRYPTALLAAEPLWEDGPIFYRGGFDGLASLVRPYQGYLHIAARMVAIVAATVPPALAPLLMNGVTILVTAGVAAFIASDRLRTAVPDRRIRLALAIGFVLMPASQDLSWHLVYLQWSLAFFLLARVIADAPGPRWVWLDRAAIGLAALTGPFSILFAPLYLWRRRQLGVTTWIVTGCATVQLAFIVTAHRTAAGETTITDAIAVFATRLFVEPLLGFRVTWLLSDAGVPLVAGGAFVLLVVTLLAIAGSTIPWPTRAVLVYGAAVVAVAGIVRSADPAWSLLAGWGGGRYFLFGIAAIVAVVIASVAVGGRWQRRAGIVLGALLLVGVVLDFRIMAPPTLGWAANSACIGGPDPCVVPVFPGGDWDLRWPGR